MSDAARGARGEVLRLGRDAGVADLEPGHAGEVCAVSRTVTATRHRTSLTAHHPALRLVGVGGVGVRRLRFVRAGRVSPRRPLDGLWAVLAPRRALSSQTPTSRCRSATAGRRVRARESPLGAGHAATGTRVALRPRPRLPARQHVRPGSHRRPHRVRARRRVRRPRPGQQRTRHAVLPHAGLWPRPLHGRPLCEPGSSSPRRAPRRERARSRHAVVGLQAEPTRTGQGRAPRTMPPTEPGAGDPNR